MDLDARELLLDISRREHSLFGDDAGHQVQRGQIEVEVDDVQASRRRLVQDFARVLLLDLEAAQPAELRRPLEEILG